MKRIFVMSVLSVFLFVGVASATTINPFGENSSDATKSLQAVLNGITVGPVPGVSSVNASGSTNDAIGFDSTWAITGSGGSFAQVVIEIAGNAANNKVGVYDAANPANKVELFSGSATKGSTVTLSILLDGSVMLNSVDTGTNFAGNAFGYYLDAGSGNVFYSNTALNADKFDHMVAFVGKNVDTIQVGNTAAGLWTNNEYILAWEDTSGGGDFDYNDFVMTAESIKPVPEPATMVLLGAGLLGLAGFARRKIS